MKLKFFKKTIICFLLIFSAIIMSLIVNYKQKGAFMNLHKKMPIYSVDTKEEKKVAFTFDVSWADEDENIDKILSTLDKYNIKATFFLVGGWIEQNEGKVKEIYNKGHEIGNHSNKHPNMLKVSKDRIIEEIDINDAKIRKITGEGTKLFRCPSGDYNDLVMDTVKSTGHYCIQWDVDSIDWKEEGANIEYNRVIKKTKPGSIILFHNNAKYTPENLPKIIEKLKNDGYQFCKVGDLIYKNSDKLDYNGKQLPN